MGLLRSNAIVVLAAPEGPPSVSRRTSTAPGESAAEQWDAGSLRG